MLEDYELYNISGGAIKWTIGLIIGGVLTFLAGIIDGYFRPLKCSR